MEELNQTLESTVQPSGLHQIETSSTRQNEQDKPQPSSAFTFLALPPELRIMVYRLILCADEPIRPGAPPGLSSSILRTCHQIRSESHPILYGENIFTIMIRPAHDGRKEFVSLFLSFHNFARQTEMKYGPRIQDMERFHIEVNLPAEYQDWNIQRTIGDVCAALSRLGKLKYLRITLKGTKTFYSQQLPQAFAKFARLQNVDCVVTEGVPPVYENYLKSKMTRNCPLTGLPQWYEELLDLANSDDTNIYARNIEQAGEAMEKDDIERFKEARKNIQAAKKLWHEFLEAAI